MSSKAELTVLRLGDVAPNFSARSTQGPITLSDFRGKWVLLFSHPADFTPVCTSEFVALARSADRFAAMGCVLVGLSVDSLFSHLAWIRLIHDRFGVAVGFPLVEDPTMEIARGYGMIGPDATDSSPVRATYFIDPDGIVRAITVYPQNVGRSIEELLRLLAALQATHDGRGLAPADWRSGAPLLDLPSQSINDVLGAARPSDWFFKPQGTTGQS